MVKVVVVYVYSPGCVEPGFGRGFAFEWRGGGGRWRPGMIGRISESGVAITEFKLVCGSMWRFLGEMGRP